eukprot:2151960-Rhodomonas_salina.2
MSGIRTRAKRRKSTKAPYKAAHERASHCKTRQKRKGKKKEKRKGRDQLDSAASLVWRVPETRSCAFVCAGRVLGAGAA